MKVTQYEASHLCYLWGRWCKQGNNVDLDFNKSSIEASLQELGVDKSTQRQLTAKFIDNDGKLRHRYIWCKNQKTTVKRSVSEIYMPEEVDVIDKAIRTLLVTKAVPNALDLHEAILMRHIQGKDHSRFDHEKAKLLGLDTRTFRDLLKQSYIYLSGALDRYDYK